MSHSVLLVLALTCFSGCIAVNSTFYTGAVVDYNFVSNQTTARDNLKENVKNFERFIKDAASYNADIIVFPEGALLGSDQTIFFTVPDPADKVIPAVNVSCCDEALRNLSSFAINSNIYVVVNIHENYTDPSSKESFLYNTNVVFARNGAVISRYRKFHLFGEVLNVTKEPEYAIFETDFGVKFGQFICFDILFKEPALNLVKEKGIKNFVYPTWWFSELPFLTAAQAQWSWAVGNNVNLLAAGVNKISRGSVGSSIIRGKLGSWSSDNYVFSNNSQSTLIVAKIPKDPNYVDSNVTYNLTRSTVFEGNNETFGMLYQPELDNFTHAEIELWANQTNTTFTKHLCHDQFCCDFDLDITYENNTLVDTIKYRAVAFSGDRVFGSVNKGKHGVEICGVYAYSNSSSNNLVQIAFGQPVRKVTFNKVKISGNFRTSNSEILPNVLLYPGENGNAINVNPIFLPTPPDVALTTGDTSQLQWTPRAGENRVITVGIHSRTFKNAANLAQMSTFALLLPLMVAALMSLKNNY